MRRIDVPRRMVWVTREAEVWWVHEIVSWSDVRDLNEKDQADKQKGVK